MFRIAEVAAQTGFSRPTLRYYEDIGLVDPPHRSEDGHRLYDQAALDQLRFVARAKRLGLTLADIGGLVDARAGGDCAETRARLQGLVDAKMDEVRRQIADATAFLAQLEAAHQALSGPPPTGDGCGCAPDLPEVEAVPIPDVAALAMVGTAGGGAAPAAEADDAGCVCCAPSG